VHALELKASCRFKEVQPYLRGITEFGYQHV
jgi:hypothetical protein